MPPPATGGIAIATSFGSGELWIIGRSLRIKHRGAKPKPPGGSRPRARRRLTWGKKPGDT